MNAVPGTEDDEADLPRIDVDALIDAGRWSAYQKRVLALCTAAILLDGMDNQILGFAMPALMKAWHLPRESFVPVVVIGLLIMSVGSGIGGWLGDRAGRRPTLVSAVGLFGLTTALSAFADDLPMLAACRFLSTLALGAALPNATALVSEFSPASRRSLSVSISMLAVVLGGLVGGALSAWLLPAYGWRVLFLAAGVLTLAVTAALLGTLVHLVTLPVEWDASFARALPLLEQGGHLYPSDLPHARRILRAAALTYVASSAASLLNVWRWLAILRR